MRKFAVIDVGSNSVRLLFVADGKVLYKALNTTRLGEGLAEKPVLLDTAVLRTANAVAEFALRAKREGAENVYAFATAAVRSAENRQDFLSAVKTLAGIDVEVLSGEEEARLGLLGALGTKDGAVCDVGGASTEIIVKAQGVLRYKKSVDVGVVRIKDKYGRDKTEMEKGLLKSCESFNDCPKIKEIVGIGGTATTIASIVLGLTSYDAEKVTGATITRAEMSALADKLAKLSVSEIEAFPCMPKGRADVLLGGVVWLALLMDALGIERMRVSDRDNLEGYALQRGFMHE